MNFFKIKTSWSNAEFIVLKLCIASAYLLIGSYFPVLVQEYLGVLLVVCTITVLWSMYLWVKKMKE